MRAALAVTLLVACDRGAAPPAVGSAHPVAVKVGADAKTYSCADTATWFEPTQPLDSQAAAQLAKAMHATCEDQQWSEMTVHCFSVSASSYPCTNTLTAKQRADFDRRYKAWATQYGGPAEPP